MEYYTGGFIGKKKNLRSHFWKKLQIGENRVYTGAPSIQLTEEYGRSITNTRVVAILFRSQKTLSVIDPNFNEIFILQLRKIHIPFP
jgi:hypothetical protein